MIGRPRRENNTVGDRGHTVIPIIHETFGGFGPEAAKILRDLAEGTKRNTPEG